MLDVVLFPVIVRTKIAVLSHPFEFINPQDCDGTLVP